MPDLCLICNSPNPEERLGGCCFQCSVEIADRVARTTDRLLSHDGCYPCKGTGFLVGWGAAPGAVRCPAEVET